jgi:hypothetical protein
MAKSNFKNWAESKIRKLGIAEFPLIKICIIAFTLMAAKLLPWLLSLEWYWYGIISALALIRPMQKIFQKK